MLPYVPGALVSNLRLFLMHFRFLHYFSFLSLVRSRREIGMGPSEVNKPKSTLMVELLIHLYNSRSPSHSYDARCGLSCKILYRRNAHLRIRFLDRTSSISDPSPTPQKRRSTSNLGYWGIGSTHGPYLKASFTSIYLHIKSFIF